MVAFVAAPLAGTFLCSEEDVPNLVDQLAQETIYGFDKFITDRQPGSWPTPRRMTPVDPQETVAFPQTGRSNIEKQTVGGSK